MRLSFSFLFISFLFASCSKNKFKVAIADEHTTLNPVGAALVEQLSIDSEFSYEILDKTTGSFQNFTKVEHNEVDLCIGSNVQYQEGHLAFDYKNIRTILPLYDMVFLVLYPDTIEASSIQDLIKGRKVGIGPKDSNTAKICLDVFKHLGVDSLDYEPVFTPFPENSIGQNQIEISCHFTGLFNPRITQMLKTEGVQIFNLEQNPLNFKSGWVLSGISQKLWTYSPYILPSNFFGDKPSEPVFTLSLQGCLYGHKDLETDYVYELIEQVVNSKSTFMKKDSYFQGIDKSFSDNYFYPLHQGAIRYIDRTKPSFWEKNIRLFGVLISIVPILISLLAPLYIKKRKKQNRYETLAREILEISAQNKPDAIDKLHVVKNKIMRKLGSKKLDFDIELQSLIIILNLTERQITEKILMKRKALESLSKKNKKKGRN